MQSDDSLQFLRDILQNGVITEEYKTHPMLVVNFNEVKSIVSSFRSHKLEHLQQNWKKHREVFIKVSFV